MSGAPASEGKIPGLKGTPSLPLRIFLTRLIWFSVLPLFILAVYLAVDHVRTMRAQIDREAADRVANAALAVDRHLRAEIAGLQTLASSPLVDDRSRWAEFYQEAQAYRENFGGHVILSDLSMQMLLNTRAPLGSTLPHLPRPKGHAAVPAVLATGKPSVGDMFFGPVAKEPLVAVVVPVVREGRIRFLLLSTIETRRFQQGLDEVAAPPGWLLTLLDGKGDVMARRPSSPGGSQPAENPGGRFSAKLNLAQWSVVLDVSPAVYRMPIVAAATALTVAILCFTLLSIVVGKIVGKRLARSVASLAEASPSPASPPLIAEVEEARRILKNAAEAREAAEQMRRESERRFRSTLDSMMEGCQIIGYDWKYLYINDAADDHNRRPKGELLGNRYMDMWPGVETTEVFGAIKRCMEDRIPHHMENEFSFPDSHKGWFDLGIQPVPEGVFILSLEITERKRAEEALAEKERHYRLLTENIKDVVWILDADTMRFRYVSPSVYELRGYTAEEVMSVPVDFALAEGAREEVLNEVRRRSEAVRAGTAPREGFYTSEVEQPCRDGSTVWTEVVTGYYVSEETGHVEVRGVTREITDRKKAEEALKTSLKEKEVLLKEIHHRVKNNLQVMSSLLNLQSQYLSDPKTRDVFKVSMDRIKSMALIHDKLYRSEDLSSISFPGYAGDLVSDLVNTYAVGRGIRLDLDIDPVSFNIDTAIPLGLIINELVSNSLKHAFSGRDGGTITISLHGEDVHMILTVSDTGVGFPEGLDFTDTPSLGMQLVVTLVEQLEGTIELIRGEGTCFRISFGAAER